MKAHLSPIAMLLHMYIDTQGGSEGYVQRLGSVRLRGARIAQ